MKNTQKQKKIVVLLAILAVLGGAGIATAGPFYPYFFNNGTTFGGYFYSPFYPNTTQITPVAPNYPQPLPPTITPVAPTPMPPYYPAPLPPQVYPTPVPQPYPYLPNTPQITPVAPQPYYPAPTPTPAPTPIPTQYTYVKITDAGFNPDVVTIQAGDTVIWTNVTSDTHGIIDANGMFTNTTIYPSGIHTFQFLNSGTYLYKDSFNGAVGKIIVQ